MSFQQVFNTLMTKIENNFAWLNLHKLGNTATGTDSISILGTATTTTGSTNIGVGSQATANYGTAIGHNSKTNASSATALGRAASASGSYSVALGYGATVASAGGKSIQIGYGTNSTANSLSVGFQGGGNYQLLDGTTGKIPAARIQTATTITSQSTNELPAGAKSVYDLVGTLVDDVEDLIDKAKKDKNNVYQVTDGNISSDGNNWDLIEYHDDTHANTLLLGNDNRFKSNSGGSDFRFQIIDTIEGTVTTAVTDANKDLAYSLFNKANFDNASWNGVLVQEGIIVIKCATPTKISKIIFKNRFNYTVPSMFTIHGANISGAFTRTITQTMFRNYAKYIGGFSTTLPATQNYETIDACHLTLDDRDSYNVFFICPNQWCSGGNGWSRYIGAFQIYGSQVANDDQLIVKMNGNYPTCKWVASNGTEYDTQTLYDQYGYIPKETVQLSRWISCFGCGLNHSSTARAINPYYPCMVAGEFTASNTADGNAFGTLRPTILKALPRVNVGFSTTAGRHRGSNTINDYTLYDYVANSSFPAGEYYWEACWGYPSTQDATTYMNNWCQCVITYTDNTTEIIQTFGHHGSQFENGKCTRTFRFYIDKPFKKFTIKVKQAHFGAGYSCYMLQTQLYYRDIAGTNSLSFIPTTTQFDLTYNTVKHKSNVHFFLTPTGIRVGSNCFVDRYDPPLRKACVGNRWINENSRLSYVCNESGVWVREDFVEIGCMTMNGSEHAGMRLRTVANEENPMLHYVHEFGNISGHIANDYEPVANGSVAYTTQPTDPPMFFCCEAKDEAESTKVFLPVNSTILQSFRRGLTVSPVYMSGIQIGLYSNNDTFPSVLTAYKTFDTAAAGELVHGEDE